MDPVESVLESLRSDRRFCSNITFWHTLHSEPPVYGDWPDGFSPDIIAALKRRGIDHLYCHQAEAVRKALQGQNVIVVTPTASGKTMCYNLPVLHHLTCVNREARA
ncbi:MAG: DEAD/DEAH box helicase, partial [Candidatus Hinthialibacter sp.]